VINNSIVEIFILIVVNVQLLAAAGTHLTRCVSTNAKGRCVHSHMVQTSEGPYVLCLVQRQQKWLALKKPLANAKSSSLKIRITESIINSFYCSDSIPLLSAQVQHLIRADRLLEVHRAILSLLLNKIN